MSRRTSGAGAVLALAVAGVVVPVAPAFADPPDPATTFVSYGNPILSDGSSYSADAAPMVHDGVLYVYAGRDQATPAQQTFVMREYQVFATDEVNPAGQATAWDHYPANLDPGDVFTWASGNNAFAGHVAEGPDGRFYWYAPVETISTQYANRMAIGVAVSDSPVGPWEDAIGEPLLDWGDVFGDSTSGQEVIDPHLFRDPDTGRIYLYWGSWYIARMVELEQDMITRVDPTTAGIHSWTQSQGLPSFFEAPWVFKRGDTYYMVYDWKQGGSECTPSNYQGCIAYSTAPSPTGPWTYRGLILGGTSATTVHPSVIEFGDAWYITYHTRDAEGGGHFRRSVAIDEITWDDTQTPARLQMATPTLDPARNPDLAASENVARKAVPSASYTESPPMDLRALNNGRIPSGMGTLPPDMWGNYRAARNVETDWTQYDWANPVLIDSAGIEFRQDSNWIRPPASWSLQYRDETGAWVDVPNASGYPTAVSTWHTVTFDPVLTTGLRATYHGQANGAQFHSVAVTEWEVYSVQAESLGAASAGTLVGEAPVLPASVEGAFPGGHTLTVPVTWYPVPASDYAAPGTFTVQGRALGQAGDLVTAQVTVVTADLPANHALEAGVTASYTAGWNNLDAVNDGVRAQLNPFANDEAWATWSGDRPASQWLQYTWSEPVDLSYVDVGFVFDGGPGRGTGVEVPESWYLEYFDGEEWQPVTGVEPDYPVEQGEYVAVSFDPVTTTQLRLTLNATLGWLEGGINQPGEYAGVGVAELEAWNKAPDVAAPVVSLSVAGTLGQAGWHIGPVTVRIDATDDSFAPVDIETSLDGGDTWDTVEGVRTHSVALGNGMHELLVRATDLSGNTSEVQTVAVQVDSVVPTVSAVASYEDRTVTVTAADVGSGLALVEVNVDAGGWEPYTDVLTLTDGAHTVTYRAFDVAGNASALGSATLAPKLDGFIGNVAPFATPTASYTAGWNNIGALNDEVRAPHTGGAQTSIWGTWSGSRPATQWIAYTWPVAVTIGSSTIGFWNDGGPGRGDGVETPTGWSLEYWDGEDWAPVEVSEDGYPVSATAYTTAEFTPVTTTGLRATIQARLGDNGTTYAAVAVGEWEVYSVSDEEPEDTTPPVVSAVFDPEARTVTVTATDEGSGVGLVEYRLGDGDWLEYTGPVSVGDEAVVFGYRATDVAGNISEAGELSIPAVGGPGLEGNIAPHAASVEASYTAGWNNLAAVNDGVLPELDGALANDTFWGTWSGDRPQTQWVGYTWDQEVTVDQVTIGFASDGGPGRGTGVETPESWVVEYLDGDDWVPVTGVEPDYPVSREFYNFLTFDPVTTTALRVVLTARVGWLEGGVNAPGQYAAVGVTELQVWTEDSGPGLPGLQPPFLTVTPTPAVPDGQDGWYVSPVSVAAQAGDVVSIGLPWTEFYNGSAWQPFSAPLTVPEGVSELAIRAVSVHGLRTAVWDGSFQVDTVAPGVAAVFDAEARTIALTAEDVTSGVAVVEYRIGDGAWTGYAAPVAVGDAAVTVQYRATDVAGNVSEVGSIEIPAVEVPFEFTDVPETHPFHAEIQWMAVTGLSTGYEDGSFGPGLGVSRQAMAAFLYRYAGAEYVPEAGQQTFTDVPSTHPFHVEIEWLAQAGIATGYEDGTFGAGRQVSRQAMASYLHRLAGEPEATTSPEFTDVPASHPFYGAIAWLAESGITTGYEDGSFGASSSVSRQAMSAFLYRFDQLGLDLDG